MSMCRFMPFPVYRLWTSEVPMQPLPPNLYSKLQKVGTWFKDDQSWDFL